MKNATMGLDLVTVRADDEILLPVLGTKADNYERGGVKRDDIRRIRECPLQVREWCGTGAASWKSG